MDGFLAAVLRAGTSSGLRIRRQVRQLAGAIRCGRRQPAGRSQRQPSACRGRARRARADRQRRPRRLDRDRRTGSRRRGDPGTASADGRPRHRRAWRGPAARRRSADRAAPVVRAARQQGPGDPQRAVGRGRWPAVRDAALHRACAARSAGGRPDVRGRVQPSGAAARAAVGALGPALLAWALDARWDIPMGSDEHVAALVDVRAAPGLPAIRGGGAGRGLAVRCVADR